MTTNRPPLPDRWEYQLAVGLLGGLLLALQHRPRRTDPSESAQLNPAVRSWLREGRSADAEHPWRTRLSSERQAIRAATSLWLAWRAHRLEKASKHVPDGSPPR